MACDLNQSECCGWNIEGHYRQTERVSGAFLDKSIHQIIQFEGLAI